MEGAPEHPVPGWYPDPEYANTQRWWDGNSWTDQRNPPLPGTKPKEEAGSGTLIVVGYITAFLLPIVGFILGIVLMVRRQTGHGLAVFLISIAVGLAACQIALDQAEEDLNRDLDRINQRFDNRFD